MPFDREKAQTVLATIGDQWVSDVFSASLAEIDRLQVAYDTLKGSFRELNAANQGRHREIDALEGQLAAAREALVRERARGIQKTDSDDFTTYAGETIYARICAEDARKLASEQLRAEYPGLGWED